MNVICTYKARNATIITTKMLNTCEFEVVISGVTEVVGLAVVVEGTEVVAFSVVNVVDVAADAPKSSCTVQLLWIVPLFQERETPKVLAS